MPSVGGYVDTKPSESESKEEEEEEEANSLVYAGFNSLEDDDGVVSGGESNGEYATPRVAVERTEQCPQCPLSFVNRRALTTHLVRIHRYKKNRLHDHFGGSVKDMKKKMDRDAQGVEMVVPGPEEDELNETDEFVGFDEHDVLLDEDEEFADHDELDEHEEFEEDEFADENEEIDFEEEEEADPDEEEEFAGLELMRNGYGNGERGMASSELNTNTANNITKNDNEDAKEGNENDDDGMIDNDGMIENDGMIDDDGTIDDDDDEEVTSTMKNIVSKEHVMRSIAGTPTDVQVGEGDTTIKASDIVVADENGVPHDEDIDMDDIKTLIEPSLFNNQYEIVNVPPVAI